MARCCEASDERMAVLRALARAELPRSRMTHWPQPECISCSMQKCLPRASVNPLGRRLHTEHSGSSTSICDFASRAESSEESAAESGGTPEQQPRPLHAWAVAGVRADEAVL
eukprot:607124-Prymnesium_polylepis.2